MPQRPGYWKVETGDHEDDPNMMCRCIFQSLEDALKALRKYSCDYVKITRKTFTDVDRF
jgi:hypothetical protein